jgi:DNA-binding FadR family transcriptional regulator
MRAILQRQEDRVGQGETATDEDTSFHYSLALAANNSMRMKLLFIACSGYDVEMVPTYLQVGWPASISGATFFSSGDA